MSETGRGRSDFWAAVGGIAAVLGLIVAVVGLYGPRVGGSPETTPINPPTAGTPNIPPQPPVTFTVTRAPRTTSDLPPSYTGHWRGRGQNVADHYIQFTLELSLNPGKISTVIGTATMEGTINCRNDLEFVAADQNGVVLWAQDSDSCTGGNDVLIVLDGEAMEYGSRNPGEPQYWMRATLYRQA